MKKYIDVLIVGTGVAGMYAALNLKSDLNVVLITKTEIRECNSYLAQGGISVAKDENDIDLFIQDTLNAGKKENSLEAVEILAKDSIENINKLIALGVDFDRVDGKIHYTREGAHSTSRIVHCKDTTGSKVVEALLKEIKSKNNITIYEETCLIDIITSDNKCFGGIVLKDGKEQKIFCKNLIMASGGIGGLFKSSTNYRSITGDGVSIALKNNVKVKNLDYIQIHPTALYDKRPFERRFLISEAVRGEGGKLLNKDKERFVNELMPRDVVSNRIIEEEKRTNMPFVNLDILDMSKEYIINRFPGIYAECLKKGIDITKDYIPVTPAQHYFMGGIEVDTFGQTSMNNLFACGEVSCSGVHGSNRLASNSLLEALVFSRRVAKYINEKISEDEEVDINSLDKNIFSWEGKNNREIILNELRKVIGAKNYELVSY